MKIEEFEKVLESLQPGPWDAGCITATDNDSELLCYFRNNADKILAVLKAAKSYMSHKSAYPGTHTIIELWDALNVSLEELEKE